MNEPREGRYADLHAAIARRGACMATASRPAVRLAIDCDDLVSKKWKFSLSNYLP